MASELDHPVYGDRSLVLRLIGALLLLVGVAALYIGPLEVHVFKLFSIGGKFAYEGFGFGSFMFANIATQVLGYYLVALVGIALGYGHLKRKRWLSLVMQSGLWAWLILGVPLIVVFVFMTFSVKVLTPFLVILILGLLAFAYFGLPWLLLRFYGGDNVLETLRAYDEKPSTLEDFPVIVLLLAMLYGFFLIVLHLLLLFNGVFPLFGKFLIDLPGYRAIGVAVIILLGLLYGVLARKPWAWWGSVVYFSLAAVMTIYTFASTSFLDLLEVLAFPAYEMEFLVNMPFKGSHFAVLAGIPLLLTLGVLMFARKHFIRMM